MAPLPPPPLSPPVHQECRRPLARQEMRRPGPRATFVVWASWDWDFGNRRYGYGLIESFHFVLSYSRPITHASWLSYRGHMPCLTCFAPCSSHSFTPGGRWEQEPGVVASWERWCKAEAERRAWCRLGQLQGWWRPRGWRSSATA